jgi:hypothetical protein
MTLSDIVAELDHWPRQATIYAFGPDDAWGPATPAIVAPASADDSVPEQANEIGFRYFLEVDLAKAVVDVARQWFGPNNVSPAQAVAAVTHYAAQDAYIEKLPDPVPGDRLNRSQGKKSNQSAWTQLHLPLE